MNEDTGLLEAPLGLNDFWVLAVEETPSEVIVMVETTADSVGCPTCDLHAEDKDRVKVDIRDLPRFGWPGTSGLAELAGALCRPRPRGQTWTEGTEHVAPWAVLTLRARRRGHAPRRRPGLPSPSSPASSSCAGGLSGRD